MMTPFISIIIPVYNSDQFLERCIESIRMQTFSDYELILVDDGSSDASWDICVKYSHLDNRIRPIRQAVNKGVSAARNRGLEAALGTWIYFCDSDDYLYNDSLEILVNYTDRNADLILAGYSRIVRGDIIEHTLPQSGIVDRTKAIEAYFESGRDRIQSFLWNRLFKRGIIEAWKIRFNESIYYKEDGLFIVQYMCRMTSGVYYVTRPVYNYVIHSASAMGIVSNQVTEKFLTNLDARIISLSEICEYADNDKIVAKAKEAVFKFELWIYATMKENGNIDMKLLSNVVIRTVKSIGILSYMCLFCKTLKNAIVKNN